MGKGRRDNPLIIFDQFAAYSIKILLHEVLNIDGGFGLAIREQGENMKSRSKRS